MKAFQILLGLFLIGILVFTASAVSKQGWDFVSLYINETLALTWQSQFNFDFSCYLILSALWILWRNQFSPSSFAVAGIAAILGILFFAPYLFIESLKAKGDVKKLLLGEREPN